MELSTWLNLLRNKCSLYEQPCFLCHLHPSQQAGLCAACLQDLPRIAPACRRCALPLAGGDGLACGRCLKKPPPYERCLAAFAYRFPLSQLIPRIKYENRPEHLGWLADAMALSVTDALGPDTFPDVLLPVPLTLNRLRRRGYNQAELLARRLGATLGIEVDRDSLTKSRETPHQMTLQGAERRRNLKDAFRWSGPAYRHVVLVDDVMTTGTTAAEISRTLLKAGVGRVDIWLLARTPEPGD